MPPQVCHLRFATSCCLVIALYDCCLLVQLLFEYDCVAIVHLIDLLCLLLTDIGVVDYDSSHRSSHSFQFTAVSQEKENGSKLTNMINLREI